MIIVTNEHSGTEEHHTSRCLNNRSCFSQTTNPVPFLTFAPPTCCVAGQWLTTDATKREPVGVSWFFGLWMAARSKWARFMETVGKIYARFVRCFVGGKSFPHLSTSFHIFPHLSTSNVTNFWSMMWCPLPHGTSSSPMENPIWPCVSSRMVPEWSTKTWPPLEAASGDVFQKQCR